MKDFRVSMPRYKIDRERLFILETIDQEPGASPPEVRHFSLASGIPALKEEALDSRAPLKPHRRFGLNLQLLEEA